MSLNPLSSESTVEFLVFPIAEAKNRANEGTSKKVTGLLNRRFGSCSFIQLCARNIFILTQPEELDSDTDKWPSHVSIQRLEAFFLVLKKETPEKIDICMQDTSLTTLLYAFGFHHFKSTLKEFDPTIRTLITKKKPLAKAAEYIRDTFELYGAEIFPIKDDFSRHLTELFSLYGPVNKQDISTRVTLYANLIKPRDAKLVLHGRDRFFVSMSCLIKSFCQFKEWNNALRPLLDPENIDDISFWMSDLMQQLEENEQYEPVVFEKAPHLSSIFQQLSALFKPNYRADFVNFTKSIVDSWFLYADDLNPEIRKSCLPLLWKEGSDLIFAFNKPLTITYLFELTTKICAPYRLQHPNASHQEMRAYLRSILFPRVENKMTQNFIAYLYKTWWFTPSEAKKNHSIIDFLTTWHTRECITTTKRESDSDLQNSVQESFRYLYPNIPFILPKSLSEIKFFYSK